MTADNGMSAPSVVVIMCDQLRASVLDVYGGPLRTAGISKLVRSGVTYDAAYTSQPLCVPARISLFTGMYPSSHRYRTNQRLLSAESWHAFKTWHSMGFTTALIGKNHCFNRSDQEDYFDVWCEIGHQGLPPGQRTKGMEWVVPTETIERAHAVRKRMLGREPVAQHAVTDLPLSGYSTAAVTSQTVAFLESMGTSPFVAWVSFPDPHAPYEVPRRILDSLALPKGAISSLLSPRVADDPVERRRVADHLFSISHLDEDDRVALLSVYLAQISWIDWGIKQVLETLERIGRRDDTIVVFCADHGDYAGDRMLMGKGGTFNESLVRIPMIVDSPSSIGHVRYSGVVSLVDLLPSLFKLQEIPSSLGMEGQVLPKVRYNSKSIPPPRKATFVEYGEGGIPVTREHLPTGQSQTRRTAMLDTLEARESEGLSVMIRSGDWKYVHDPITRQHELYNLSRDPVEAENLIHGECSTHQDVLSSLREHLLNRSLLKLR